MVSHAYPSLFAGDTIQLRVDSSRQGSPDLAVTWTSRSPDVVTVTGDGIVRGHRAGWGTVTAQAPCGARDVRVAVLEPRIGTNREIGYLGDTLRWDGQPVDQVKTTLADGSGRARISRAGELAQHLSWSPDGSQLIVAYGQLDGLGRAGSWLLAPNGSGERFLGDYLWSPEWSPDGSQIAYRNYISSGDSDIYVMAPDGSGVRRLTTAPGDDLIPQWSPDGRQILYQRDFRSGTPALWLMTADSLERRKLDLPVPAWNPRWSPDGKRIAFDNQRAVWVVNADGTGARPLTANCSASGGCTGTETYRSPAWSPDGRRIAYGKWQGGRQFLVVARADGAAPLTVEVTGPCCTPLSPQWSPDGTRIAVAAFKNESPWWRGIRVIGADGAGDVFVSGEENAGLPRWRP